MTYNFQRTGAISNAHEGKSFEMRTKEFFREIQNLDLSECRSVCSVDIGVGRKKKPHLFDLSSQEKKVIVECKSHRWTSGDNVPSAKLTVWNEAMYYFHLSSNKYRKIFFVLKDYSLKKKKTLASYYISVYAHLIPDDVEFWEYDLDTSLAERIR